MLSERVLKYIIDDFDFSNIPIYSNSAIMVKLINNDNSESLNNNIKWVKFLQLHPNLTNIGIKLWAQLKIWGA